MDLVIAEDARTTLLADLRGHGGIVHVLDLQDLTAVMIIRQEGVLEDALADLPHHLVIEEDVVLTEERPTERLLGLGEVMQVAARILGADRALAQGVDLLLRELIDRATQLQDAA